MLLEIANKADVVAKPAGYTHITIYDYYIQRKINSTVSVFFLTSNTAYH